MAVVTSTINDLLPGIADRLQDPNFTFWDASMQARPALAEAINDLMLLVGRPTIQYNTLIRIQPNTVWQPMPANLICITNMRTDQFSLHKTSLRTMDYPPGGNWSSDWQSDVSVAGPKRWGPLGLTRFFVHPAPTVEMQVTIAGVAAPITTSWPPSGTESSPFQSEFNVALQLYAAAYLRIKELGDDAYEGQQLYQEYLEMAARWTSISDRRDPILFSRSFGVPTGISSVTNR